MVHQGLGSFFFGHSVGLNLLFRLGIVLQDRVKPTFICLDFFMCHVLYLWDSFAKRFFSTLALFVEVHLSLPSIDTVLILLEDHQKFHYYLYQSNYIRAQFIRNYKIDNHWKHWSLAYMYAVNYSYVIESYLNHSNYRSSSKLGRFEGLWSTILTNSCLKESLSLMCYFSSKLTQNR